ncbi:MAG: hypothetical protein IT320_28230 [Anaerolineae bacterium]|nr:hypothetical protein [Anaerolineae bacterium]
MPLTVGRSIGFSGRWVNTEGVYFSSAYTEGSGSGLTTYTFNNGGAGFSTYTHPGFENTTRYVLVATVGTGSASRTLSSISATSGSTTVSGVEVLSANSSASVLAAGWYLINIGNFDVDSVFSLDVTFSGAMLGAGVYVLQMIDHIGSDDPMGTTYGAFVTSGDPIISTAGAAGSTVRRPYYLAIAAQSATSVADIDWGTSEAGTYTSEGTDIVYGSRMFSVSVASITTGYHAGADFLSAPTNPRLLFIQPLTMSINECL